MTQQFSFLGNIKTNLNNEIFFHNKNYNKTLNMVTCYVFKINVGKTDN